MRKAIATIATLLIALIGPVGLVSAATRPIPFGHTAVVSGWRIKVTEVSSASESRVPKGYHALTVTVRATRVASSPQYTAYIDEGVLGSNRVELDNTSSPSCLAPFSAPNTSGEVGASSNAVPSNIETNRSLSGSRTGPGVGLCVPVRDGQ